MSLWREALGHVRKVILLDAAVGRLETKVDDLDAKVGNHNDRLIAVETILSFGRGLPRPPQPRLPRR